LEKITNTLRNLDEAAATAGGAGDATGSGPTIQPASSRDGNRDIGPLKPAAGPVAEYHAKFCAAMDDDFNAPQAIAALFDAAREANGALSAAKPDQRTLAGWSEFLRWGAGDVLGLLPAGAQTAQDGRDATEALVKLLLEVRADVRGAKLFPLSDKIRDGLAGAGIVIEDKKEGTSWRRG
jgi:cysteinyl-tRNA synthetase